MVTAVLTGLKTSCYSRKTGRVVINFDDHFTCFRGLSRCRSTTCLPLRFFFWLNSFLAVLKSPFHSCFTSSMVLLATPTALTFSVCNGFPCFSFGLIRHIVGKLALQDAFVRLHVFCNYCQLSGSKIWFPLSFFCTVSGMLFRVHVYTTYRDTEKFRPFTPFEVL